MLSNISEEPTAFFFYLKMETVGSSKMLISFSKITWCKSPDQHLSKLAFIIVFNITYLTININ